MKNYWLNFGIVTVVLAGSVLILGVLMGTVVLIMEFPYVGVPLATVVLVALLSACISLAQNS